MVGLLIPTRRIITIKEYSVYSQCGQYRQCLYIESADLTNYGILNISNNTTNSSVVYILDGIANLTGDITICNTYGTVFVFASQLIFDGQTNIMND